MAGVELKKPPWIRTSVPGGKDYVRVKGAIEKYALHTVCLEARCPNIGECLSSGTATFLIMGDVCTRNCLYCSVKKGIPFETDYAEPERVGDAVKELALSHAVITSVTRDDLSDGGASIFADTVASIRKKSPYTTVEILVPDFKNSQEKSVAVLKENPPDIFNHNIEVAGPLYNKLRPAGSYAKSLELISMLSLTGIPVKSGLMTGFGETMDEIFMTIEDLKSSGCTVLTAGQYLRSSAHGFHVAKYYTPEEFKIIEDYALSRGFSSAACAPLVRSSYRAGELFCSGNNPETACCK